MTNEIVDMLDKFSQEWRDENEEEIDYFTQGVKDLQRKHESLIGEIKGDKGDLKADIANKEGEITVIKSTIESYEDDLENYQEQEGNSKADLVEAEDVLEKLQEDLLRIINE